MKCPIEEVGWTPAAAAGTGAARGQRVGGAHRARELVSALAEEEAERLGVADQRIRIGGQRTPRAGKVYFKPDENGERRELTGDAIRQRKLTPAIQRLATRVLRRDAHL